MNRILTLLAVTSLSGCAVFMAAKQPDKKDLDLMRVGMHRNVLISEFGKPISVNDIDGKSVKLEQFKGKAILIVNVASKCGNTPQYEGLEKIYKQYKDKAICDCEKSVCTNHPG